MNTDVQPASPHENGSKVEDSPFIDSATTNKTPPKSLSTSEKRSRSRTPQKKKGKKTDETGKGALAKVDEKTNAVESENGETNKLEDESVQENGHAEGESTKENGHSEEEKSVEPTKINKKQEWQEDVKGTDKKKSDQEMITGTEPKSTSDASLKDVVEMDPLILASDEPDPELQFDENSDMDSVKGSPVQSRCKTRRSHTRNIPTPKTPKSATDSESEKNSIAPTPTPENLNDTTESINLEDVSTKVQIGGDSTRVECSNNEGSLSADADIYFSVSRDHSLSDTIRSLSGRKSIRPLNDSYRQRAFKNNLNKSDLNAPYQGRISTDRITALKRKRSATPEERKRFRPDEGGLLSYISSPLNFLKSKFGLDENSSTPKLTGYKDSTSEIHGEGTYSEVLPEGQEKSRCTVM